MKIKITNDISKFIKKITNIKNINETIIILGILFFFILILLHYIKIQNIFAEGYEDCTPDDRGAALPLFKNISKIKTFKNRINSNILKLEDSIIKNESVIKKTSKKSESDADKNVNSTGIKIKK